MAWNRHHRYHGPAARALIAVAVVLLASCVPTRGQDIHDLFSESPSHRFENYAFDPDGPPASRIAEAPPFLIDYLEEIDDVEEYRSYLPDEGEKEMLAGYIDELPPLSRTVMEERLIGIYFIEDFRGSGLMDFVLDEEGGTYAVMIVNADSLRTGMSEWMTYREGTCFAPSDSGNPAGGPIRVRVDCGEAYAGAMYVLLHESAHVADLIRGITPFVEDSIVVLKDLDPPESTPFTEGYWENYCVTAAEYRRDFMESVTFYGFGGGPRMEASDAPAVYRSLARTPYASLYATMSWAEDLAEYVTWYHWTVVLGQPYELSAWDGEAPLYSYRPMENPAVLERAGTLGAFYGN